MKKRTIVQTCIALLAALFVLGFVSCDSGGGGGGGGSKTDDATLTSVKFGNETATLGTPKASLAEVVAGSVTILSANVEAIATAKESTAKIEYWLDAGGAGGAPDFFASTYNSFTTGDILNIKVVKGKATLYYKIVVTIPANVATLTTLSVDGVSVVLTGSSGGTSVATAPFLDVLLAKKMAAQPATGVPIVATASVDTAVVEWGKGTAEPATYTAYAEDAAALFAQDEVLYLKVTNDGVSVYYKVRITFQLDGEIRYGSVVIKASSEKYIDPKWDDPTLEIYPIDRIFLNDGSTKLPEITATVAKAKALWDEGGLYIYLWVVDFDPSGTDNEHETDSFELFVNEGYDETLPAQVYANTLPNGGGSQYRVNTHGTISGEGGSPAALNAHNVNGDKVSVWASDNVDGNDNPGYIVIMQAPWRLRSKFLSPTSYKNDWKFGFELQVNCAAETGNRYGTKVWNNTSNTNYQNATNYGVAKLIGAPAVLNFPALPPVITTQPAGGSFKSGETTTLTVEASTPLDGGTITYQWFEADAAADVGTAKGTGATLVLADLTEGRKFYYAIATNTLGSKTATTKSSVAGIVVSGIPQVNKIISSNGAFAIFKIELPTGSTWGDYEKVTAQYYLDAANLDKSPRAIRLMGNYTATDVAGGSVGNSSNTNAPYIMDNTSSAGISNGNYPAKVSAIAGAAANKWFTISYNITGSPGASGSTTDFAHSGFLVANIPAATATGPFYFAVGIAGQANETLEQLIRNVTLVHKTEAAKNAVSNEYICGFEYGSDPIIQSLVDDPDPDTGPTNWVVDLTAATTKNAAAFSGNYSGGFAIATGDGFDVANYKSVTIVSKFTDSAGATITPAASSLQLKWFPEVETNANGANPYGTTYNVAQDTPAAGDGTTSVTINIPATVTGALKSLGFQNGGNTTVGFWEVVSITFILKD